MKPSFGDVLRSKSDQARDVTIMVIGRDDYVVEVMVLKADPASARFWWKPGQIERIDSEALGRFEEALVGTPGFIVAITDDDTTWGELEYRE